MLEDVVFLHAPLLPCFSQEFHEKLFWNFCEAKRNLFSRFTKWSLPYSIITDSSTVVKLFIVNADSSVPNTFEVFANKLLGHLGGHALGKIVLVKNDFKHIGLIKV